MSMDAEQYHTTFSEHKDVLSVADVQKILSISRQQVYRLIDAEKLWAIKPGKNFLISKKSLICYVDGVHYLSSNSQTPIKISPDTNEVVDNSTYNANPWLDLRNLQVVQSLLDQYNIGSVGQLQKILAGSQVNSLINEP